MLLQEALDSIAGLDEDMMLKAQLRLDSLTKPLGSLGRLEDIVRQLAGITGELYPSVHRKAIVVMCADNGVVEEGVAQTSKSVTSAVTRNFTKGFTAINVLAGHSKAELAIVDIGVDDDLSVDGILDRKIRRGTRNIAKGPAMTGQEAVKAIEAGIGVVSELHGRGVNLLGTGEMGIGNTTTSSAVASVLTGSSVEKMVGRGAGLSDEGLINKIRVVKQAIKLNRPDPNDPLEVLSKLGGLDIAGLVGCYIGAAAFRIPILVDGFISSAAALIAVNIKSEIRSFILPSHGSAEPGNRAVMDALGMEPLMNLRMRLGEGTGAALAFHIVDAAVAAYRDMGTFDDANIQKYTHL